MTLPTPDAPANPPEPATAAASRPRDPRQGRREIDDALSRDRGRLQGLWSRWNAQPADTRAADAFATALQASVTLRQARAARLPEGRVQPDLQCAAGDGEGGDAGEWDGGLV